MASMPGWKRVRWLFMVMALGIAPPSLAGQAVGLTTGARVRLRVSEDSRVWDGTLLAITTDSLGLEPRGGGPRLMLARAALTRVEVFQGRRHPVLRNALIGAALGAAVGASAGAMAQVCRPEDPPTCEPRDATRGELIAEGAAIYGGLGLLAGVVLGMIGHDQWSGLPVPLAGVIPGVLDRRLAIGWRVAIRSVK